MRIIMPVLQTHCDIMRYICEVPCKNRIARWKGRHEIGSERMKDGEVKARSLFSTPSIAKTLYPRPFPFQWLTFSPVSNHLPSLTWSQWDKGHVMHIYGGILLSHRKKWSPDTCYPEDELQKHDAERPDTKGHRCMIPFIWNTQN